jgi:hypothetical protein
MGSSSPRRSTSCGGTTFIVHAGDIGDPAIVSELARLAPVAAVRGNVGTRAWAQSIPATEALEVAGETFPYVLPNIADLDLDPAASVFHAVVYGHSHQPEVRW